MCAARVECTPCDLRFREAVNWLRLTRGGNYEDMRALTNFERWILAQPVPALNLPALEPWADSEVDLAERAAILLYGITCPRGEDHLVRLAIAVGILPGGDDEVRQLEIAGY